MSQDQTPTESPAPDSETAPLLEGIDGRPIKFKPRLFEAAQPDKGTRPTSRDDCQVVGGHGGANGKLVYRRSDNFLGKTAAKELGEPLICAVCGEVDI